MKWHRFALLFVVLLFYVGRDSRYSEKAPLSVLFVVEWNLIWAISLVAEKQLFRVLSSNVVLSVCACESVDSIHACMPAHGNWPMHA